MIVLITFFPLYIRCRFSAAVPAANRVSHAISKSSHRTAEEHRGVVMQSGGGVWHTVYETDPGPQIPGRGSPAPLMCALQWP